MIFADAASGVVFSASALWCAYALACRIDSGRSASARLTTAAVLLLWLLTAAFLLLSAARLFVAPVSLAGWAIAAVVAHRLARRVADPVRQARADLDAICSWWRTLGLSLQLLLAAGFALVSIRLIHGLMAPSLTWDALT